MAEEALTSPDLLAVIGARPQFIKSAASTRVLGHFGISQFLLHTGQHPDPEMGLDFLKELGVPAPDGILSPSQESRTHRLADMMEGVADAIGRLRPKAVMVFGDTDSTLAGALAGHHAGIPVVHVEAGLRSGDRSMPEEHNRILTDQVSDVLCTTGPDATRQLLQEGVDQARIVEVGDVMLDVALAARDALRERVPPGWPVGPGPTMVATLHRPGTVDHPELLAGALETLELWCGQTGGRVYFPVHPRTAGIMLNHGFELPQSVVNPGPVGYLDMQAALIHADCVLTDSGGVQKEAWYQGTPAVVLRNTTEWRELLEIGASTLFDPAMLTEAGGRSQLVDRLASVGPVPSVLGSGLFGEGRAAHRMLEIIRSIL